MVNLLSWFCLFYLIAFFNDLVNLVGTKQAWVNRLAGVISGILGIVIAKQIFGGDFPRPSLVTLSLIFWVNILMIVICRLFKEQLISLEATVLKVKAYLEHLPIFESDNLGLKREPDIKQ